MSGNEGLSYFLEEFKSEVSGIVEIISSQESFEECVATEEITDYDSSLFLNKLNESLLVLQKKAIFLSLIFLDNCRPQLSDITSSCEEFKASVFSVSSVSLKCPKSVGKTLLANWTLYLRNMAKNVIDFVDSLLKAVASGDSTQVKTCVGKLCHDVEAFSKLPKSNKLAARIAAQSGLALVEDALEELTAEDFPIRSSASDPSNNLSELLENLGVGDSRSQMIMTSSGENQSNMSLADEFVSLDSILSDGELRQLIQIAVGLVKTVKACLKKACSVLSLDDGPTTVPSDSQNEVVDEIIECCNKMSPTCDEFVLALYPPRRARLLESEATDLSAAMRKLIQAIRESNFVVEADDKQLDILTKAIEHNSSKLIGFLNAQIH